MLPTDAQRVENHNYPPAHSPGYPNNPHPPPPSHHHQQQQQQQHRGDKGMAFGQLRQAVSSRLCDLLDEAGIHATRVVSGRRFIRWDTVPKLLALQNAYISGLPYEFFFAKASTGATTTPMSTSSTSTFNANGGTNAFNTIPVPHAGYSLPPSQNDNEEEGVSIHPFDGMPNSGAGFGSLPPLRFPSGAPAHHPHPHSSIQVDEGFINNNRQEGNAFDPSADADAEIAQTLIGQLHAQPLNINILSWKKQTIEHILDGLEKQRIRILTRPKGRDVIFELELPATGSREENGGTLKTVDIPRWPDVYPHSNAFGHSYSQGPSHGTGAGAGIAFPTQSSSGNAFLSVQSNNNNGPSPGGPVRNPRPDRELRRKSSTNTNTSTATGSAGSDTTASSWSGGGDAQTQRQGVHGMSRYDVYGDEESRSADISPGGVKREPPVDERMHDVKGRGHGRNGSRSAMTMTMEGPAVVPLVHNHTLTPSPFRSHYQDHSQSSTKQRRAKAQNDGQFGTLQSEAGQSSQLLLAGVQHVSRPIISASTSSNNVGSFLTTPTPTKKWTRRSSPDRIFMNVTLNGILRNAGMPIPRQKDDASRLPWSSIPQFLAENGLYIRGWPEANLPWLYSGDMGAKATGTAAANLASGASGGGPHGQGPSGGGAGIGDWRDRIDWKSSPSQRSYKLLAQALRSGDIQILPRPRGRDVLFEVRDAQGRCYDSTLGLSDEWKQKFMRDSAAAAGSAPGSPPALLASSSAGGELKFVNVSSARNEASSQRRGGGHGSNFQMRQPVLDEDEPEEEEKERGRPGYHYSSASYSRSGSSLTRNTAVESELPSPTETTASTSSGATKRQGHIAFSRGYHSARNTPPGAAQDVVPRPGYQNLVYPSGPSPLAYPYPGKASSFPPPNQFHDVHSQLRRSTPPITSYDRDGASSGSRFPQLVNRQYSESTVRFQRPSFPPAEVQNNSSSCGNTPSPDSSQRQRTVSLGTSSASTGTGTVLSGSSSGVPTLVHPNRSGRYNLPSLSHGTMDIDMDLDDPNLNRLPPLIHLKPDGEVQREDEGRPLVFPSISPLLLRRGASASASSGHFSPPPGSTSSSSLPTHLPSPLVAFSQPTWSAAERGWKLAVLDPARASLPPVGDTILWDMERRSWKLTWAADTESSTGRRSPAALWSTEQDAWILDP